MSEINLTEAAIQLAKDGLAIFPCGKDKKPLTPHGFKDASKNKPTIRNWWTRWSDAAMGVPTGEINDIVVLDVDMDSERGLDGEAALQALLTREDAVISTTRTVRTPRGGLHLYFKHPGRPVKNSTSKIGPGLDIKADGGYVIAPPSRNGTGQAYKIEVEGPIADLPTWLAKLIVEPFRKQASPPAKGVDDIPDRAKVEEALRCISANCSFDDWLRIGMALHSWNNTEGRPLWDSWSRTAPERYEEAAIERHWKSFKPGAVTIATMFKQAIDAGWKPVRKSTERSNTEPATSGKPSQAQSNSSAKVSRDLETKYGPPYFFHINEKTDKKIYQGLNESYFAGLHAARNIELWEPLERTFYKYERRTGLYQDSTSDAIKQEISESILAMARTVNLIGLVKDRADKRLAAIVSQLKGIIEKRDAFKKNEPFIHLANGVLVFRNDDADLTEFSPTYFSRNQSPIAFDSKACCDRFLNELILPAVHPEDVAIIQKYMGLCLLGRNIIQRFLILDGKEGRGKSQLAIAFQHIVGLLNCTQLRTEHLHERFELYRYLKKTLLVGVDVPADFLSTKGATVIKGLVGGDILDAEQKNGIDCFPMEGTFCIVVTSNSRLRVRLEGDTGAWRRRLLIVRYEAPPPAKKIPDFGKTLVAAEGSGILNWALQGLAALLHDVNEIGDIHLTPRQSGMVDSLLAESDSLRCFLRDCVMRSDTSDLTVSEIIQAYAEYCPTKGWNPMPITVIHRQVEALILELFQTVKAHSIERDGKSQKGFHHVCLK